MSVSAFVAHVNEALKASWDPSELAVEGEVTGFRVSQGQWVNFDIKDDAALVNVFMPVWNLNVPVEDGIKVRVYGQPRVYPKFGKFSLSAERVELSGEGTLKKALALLRARLDKEGLFDPSRKRALPRFPRRIALVASRESAAYGDFVRVVGERWGGLDIDLFHVMVQGEKAPADIVAAIEQAQAGDYDALVMTRGGGSFEELMAFNDERVVRAVHASRIPTLVAIGHERDITLAEEAADVRGSTPTDCARRLVPDKKDVLYELASLMGGITTGLDAEIERRHTILERALTAPGAWVRDRLGAVQHAASLCADRVEQWVRRLDERLETDMRLITSMDPERVLERGYAIVRDSRGRAVTAVKGLALGTMLNLRLKDGQAGVTVSRLGKGSGQSPIQSSLL